MALPVSDARAVHEVFPDPAVFRIDHYLVARQGITEMSERFKPGDQVRWNSEAGLKSDKTDHIAMHKGSALHKIA
jgi:hypothetical protein